MSHNIAAALTQRPIWNSSPMTMRRSTLILFCFGYFLHLFLSQLLFFLLISFLFSLKDAMEINRKEKRRSLIPSKFLPDSRNRENTDKSVFLTLPEDEFEVKRVFRSHSISLLSLVLYLSKPVLKYHRVRSLQWINSSCF
jgi:hypothetical protein